MLQCPTPSFSGSNDAKTSSILMSSSVCGGCDDEWGICSWYGCMFGFRRYFCRPPRTRSRRTPSFSIPINKHFLKRHAWQAFRRRLLISQSLFAGHVYSMLPKRLRFSLNELLLWFPFRCFTLNRSLEERFTGFAASNSIVESWRDVSAH